MLSRDCLSKVAASGGLVLIIFPPGVTKEVTSKHAYRIIGFSSPVSMQTKHTQRLLAVKQLWCDVKTEGLHAKASHT